MNQNVYNFSSFLIKQASGMHIFHTHFHPLEFVCRFRDPQIPEGENLKVIYHPLYDMNNYILIWGDWLSCDTFKLYNLPASKGWFTSGILC